jgi:hypothetical protein
MADTPLGKGLIEIGANLAPLEAGLAQAQAKTRAALGGASVGIGGTATGAGAATSSDTFAKNSESIAQSSARTQASTTRVESDTRKTADNSTKISDGASKSAVSFDKIRSTAAILVGSIAKLIDGMAQFKGAAVAVGNELGGLRDAYVSIGESQIGSSERALRGIERQRDATLRNIDAQEASANFIEKFAHWANEGAYYEAQKGIAIQAANDALETQKKLIEEQQKIREQSLTDENYKRRIALEEDKSIKATMEYKFEKEKVMLALQDVRSKKERDALVERLNILKLEYEKKMEAARLEEAERKQKIQDEKNEQLKADAEVAKRKREELDRFQQAQRESFANLQNQINSLFNTGNLEVGINRVASLVQVLIDKTERR